MLSLHWETRERDQLLSWGQNKPLKWDKTGWFAVRVAIGLIAAGFSYIDTSFCVFKWARRLLLVCDISAPFCRSSGIKWNNFARYSEKLRKQKWLGWEGSGLTRHITDGQTLEQPHVLVQRVSIGDIKVR